MMFLRGGDAEGKTVEGFLKKISVIFEKLQSLLKYDLITILRICNFLLIKIVQV